MKTLGYIALTIGVIWLLVALNLDTSVDTGYGSRVNNIGLMASKQNHILIGGIVTLCGLLMVMFGKGAGENNMATVKCPFCAEDINPKAIKCKHCGSDVEQHTSKLREPRVLGVEITDIVIDDGAGGQTMNHNAINNLASALHNKMPKNSALSVMVTYSPTISRIKEGMDKKIGRDFEIALEEAIKLEKKKA